MPYLMLLDDKGLPVRDWRVTDEPLTVGRAKTMAAAVDDPRMSRQHFKLELVDDQIWITDTASKTGVKVNGQPRVSTLLKSGDMIEAGDTTFMYEAGANTVIADPGADANQTTIGKVIGGLRMPKQDGDSA